MWPKLLLIAGALVDTGGPVRTGYSEFLPKDPLPKLLPEDTGESPAGGTSVLTLLQCSSSDINYTLYLSHQLVGPSPLPQ